MSYSKGLFSDKTLEDILQTSRRNNQRSGVTGVLLYADGSIIQALEGPKETVVALYETILQDPRHWHISTVLSRPIRQRTFSEWSMGFQAVSTIEIEDIRNLIITQRGRQSAIMYSDNVVLGLLQLFYASHFRNAPS
ncbi:BLUF domain-containing protein [Larkinella insperata]|uniref:BLUF domain-containing protein n=1 Tax=Larkinella insperata TaxID=332158 RepID=A0ABW3QG61_9BACT